MEFPSEKTSFWVSVIGTIASCAGFLFAIWATRSARAARSAETDAKNAASVARNAEAAAKESETAAKEAAEQVRGISSVVNISFLLKECQLLGVLFSAKRKELALDCAGRIRVKIHAVTKNPRIDGHLAEGAGDEMIAALSAVEDVLANSFTKMTSDEFADCQAKIRFVQGHISSAQEMCKLTAGAPE